MLYSIILTFSILFLPFSPILSLFFVVFSLAAVERKTFIEVRWIYYLVILISLSLLYVSRGFFVLPSDDMASYFNNFVNIQSDLSRMYEFGPEVALPFLNYILSYVIPYDKPVLLAYVYVFIQLLLLLFIFESHLKEQENSNVILALVILFLGPITFTQLVRQSFSSIFVIWSLIAYIKYRRGFIFTLVIAFTFHITSFFVFISGVLIYKYIYLTKKSIFYVLIMSIFLVLISFNIKFLLIFFVDLSPDIIKIKFYSFLNRPSNLDFFSIIKFSHKLIIAMLIGLFAVLLGNYRNVKSDLALSIFLLSCVFSLEIISNNSSERAMLIVGSFISGYIIFKNLCNIGNKIFLSGGLLVVLISYSSFIFFKNQEANDNPFSLGYGYELLSFVPFEYTNYILETINNSNR